MASPKKFRNRPRQPLRGLSGVRPRFPAIPRERPANDFGGKIFYAGIPRDSPRFAWESPGRLAVLRFSVIWRRTDFLGIPREIKLFGQKLGTLKVFRTFVIFVVLFDFSLFCCVSGPVTVFQEIAFNAQGPPPSGPWRPSPFPLNSS